MFKTVEEPVKVDKAEYEKEMAKLRIELLKLQQRLKSEKKVSVVILLNGPQGTGKSDMMRLLTSWLDPRGVEVNAFGRDDESQGRPDFWRFWMKLPPKGAIGIFFGSWYTKMILDRTVEDTGKEEFLNRVENINHFERHLAAEDVLLIKFWLHLPKKVQEERVKKLRKDPEKSWILENPELKYFDDLDRYYKVAESAIERTGEGSQWVLVNASDRYWRELQAVKTIVGELSELFEKPALPRPAPMPVPKERPASVLDKLDMKSKIERKDYEEKLEELQNEIGKLSWEAWERGIPSIAVFEGWDAAGKGGNIKRLISSLDPRNYSVVSIAAPTEEEKVKPYLWRFWRKLPTKGRTTVFDRSWYGRVLVERVEGFCRSEDWKRAFPEINDFEQQLVQSGAMLTKFWLHITPEEQMRRFKERERLEYKRHKINAEDYRNREKWNAYLKALDEMFMHNNTTIAPWTLVEANDKLTGRLQVLTTFRDGLKNALGKSKNKRLREYREG